MPRRLALLAFTALLLTALAIPQSLATGGYRLQFWLHETQPGHAAVVWTYSLLVQPDSGTSSIQSGERIPVKTGPDKYEYERVGRSLSCSIDSRRKDVPASSVALQVQVSISSIAPNSVPLQPVLVSNDSRVVAVVPLGGRISIAKFDDAATHAGYELEVQATPAGGVSN
ncbi:MAG: hypothetical protein ACRD1E_12785 [Terriglobales bacterium]